ncbi:GerMN domain-containing protein [Blastococcus tunisiensis]|uniref:Sporulation and spore germination n=1 Tax=Blastococcus tunisiensis TaxID=1798228 RepID=A0A1I2J3N8_9ACTN|nr:GerMN domain-containing protein [Blastococcus sp. DSM 46838]SFF47341.1 Sporulation and spore germination [Blastococcus sp. DSM 46838]
MRTALLALAAVLLVAGCGIDPQARPEVVSIAPPSTGEAGRSGEPDDPQLRVYLVRGARLEPVIRSHPQPGIDAALELLAAGPTRVEVLVGGLRTALPPQSLFPDPSSGDTAVVTIAVTRDFTEISGVSQLLAMAQVVWTVTEDPRVGGVRITEDGRPLEVPTDSGLTRLAVDRDDYLSAAPAAPAPAPSGAPRSEEPGGPAPGTAPPAAPTTGRRRPVPR